MRVRARAGARNPMGKRSQQRLTRQISGRIPGPALMPFLLFWCLGSFALGQELARMPLAALAAAAVQPLQSALQVQGALAHAAPITHTHQVATGLLGSKPPTALAHKTSGKTAHGKTKQSSRDRSLGRSSLNGSAASRHGMAAIGVNASRGQMFVDTMDGASRYWGSHVSWSEQRGWTVAAGWNPQFASGGGTLWVDLGHATRPCSPWPPVSAASLHRRPLRAQAPGVGVIRI